MNDFDGLSVPEVNQLCELYCVQFPCTPGPGHVFDKRGSNGTVARGNCSVRGMLYTFRVLTTRLRVYKTR